MKQPDPNAPPRVALVVDNPFRDLPGMVLVALRLCQQGAECYLVPMNLQEREIGALAPDFVLLNYLRKGNDALAQHLINAGVEVGVLDTEGGVLSSLNSYEQIMAPSANLRDQVSVLCTWGHKLAAHAVEHRWYREDQVAVTGAPRFDYYVEPWRQASLEMSEYAELYRQPLVLLNGSFSVANPLSGSPEQEANFLVRRFDYDREEIDRYQRTQRETLLGMADLANRLAARFPEVTFVYRPHPFEKLRTYEKLFEPLGNLHLIREGTVDGWILRASAVIQRGCSTAIEAGVAGVPALTPAWLPAAEHFESVESVSVQCASYEEMESVVEQIQAGVYAVPPEVRANLEQVITDWFRAIDGTSNERVATAIADSLTTREVPDLHECRLLLYYPTRPHASLKKRIQNHIRYHLRLSPAYSFRQWRPATTGKWEKSDKSFGVEHVARIVESVSSLLEDVFDVGLATERRAYHFGYDQGKAVRIASKTPVATHTPSPHASTVS